MSIQLIQQAIRYMEEHIYEDINYTDVARNIHMSNYNFHRTFSFIAGMTANEYIRNRRLTLAAQELQTPPISTAMNRRKVFPKPFRVSTVPRRSRRKSRARSFTYSIPL